MQGGVRKRIGCFAQGNGGWFWGRGRVSARSGQGLPELLRWPRNAFRPCGLICLRILNDKRPENKRCPAQSDSRPPLPGPRRHACGSAEEKGRQELCEGCRAICRVHARIACRRGPGKDCRNFLAGLVMLPGLEVWASCRVLHGGGQEANDAWLGQTADSPCPDRADTLVAVRKKGRQDLYGGPCPDRADALAAVREGLKAL
jgi:hypothetical protein